MWSESGSGDWHCNVAGVMVKIFNRAWKDLRDATFGGLPVGSPPYDLSAVMAKIKSSICSYNCEKLYEGDSPS